MASKPGRRRVPGWFAPASLGVTFPGRCGAWRYRKIMGNSRAARSSAMPIYAELGIADEPVVGQAVAAAPGPFRLAGGRVLRGSGCAARG